MTCSKMTMVAIAASLAFFPTLSFADEKSEIDAAVEKGFTDMDTDKDGTISRTEYETFTRAFIDEKAKEFETEYAALDVNKDGKLDKEEVSVNAALKTYFAQLDFNSDGFLDKAEMSAALKAAAEAQSGG